MKTGFSSLACPGWDLATIVSQAASLGFDGVELRGLRGELHLPLAPELSSRPEKVRGLFADNKVELFCLGSSATLTSKNPREVAEQRANLVEYIELAAALGCPCVKFFAGDVPRWDNHRVCLSRMVEALQALVPVAARHEVTLLVENGGDFSSSNDLWFIVDAISHPCVKACWNQVNGMIAQEKPTLSLPRLGQKMQMVHLCDGDFDEAGVLQAYKPLGEGNLDVARLVDILKGLVYRGYLVFEWPKLWNSSLPDPADALPAAAAWMREALDAKQNILSAYKNDKNAPKFRETDQNAPA